jgi:D-sedoheptulose 7-phosphate isomerase
MKNIDFTVQNYIQEHHKAFSNLDMDQVYLCSDLVVNAIKKNKKIVTCGNGGSAFTASHYITDWNKMYNLSTGKKLRGLSLSDNVGLITAYGNDVDFDSVFSGQIEALMDKGDLLIVVSGSGNSPNIIAAIKAARMIGAHIVGVLGYDGGKAKPLCDASFHVPSWDMQICEDIHLSFGHLIMKRICGDTIRPVVGQI